MTLSTWNCYVSPLDQEARDWRARLLKKARASERKSRRCAWNTGTAMSRFLRTVGRLFVGATFVAVSLGALACDEGDTIYNTSCKPKKPHEWEWNKAVAAPDAVTLDRCFDPREIALLSDAANGVSDADAAEFAARMGEEFQLLWQWYLTLTPDQRANVLHYIKLQTALAGGGDYAWEDQNGWHYADSDGVSGFTGLR